MSKFADQLFEDLMHEHGTSLATTPVRPAARRAGRPVWLTTGALAAAGAVAVGVTLTGGTTAAYAVTENGDGTVTISVHDLSGVGGANGKLHTLGLPVVAVPMRAGCVPFDTLAARGRPGTKVTLGATTAKDGSVTVDVQGVPKGETMLVAFGEAADGKITGSMVLIAGDAPACVSQPAGVPGPGAGLQSASAGGPGASAAAS